MKLHMLRSLTSITGASAQAPRHSQCCTVNRPSGVVSPSVAAAQLARQIGAHVQLEAADGLLVEHVVEAGDFVHGHGRHAQVFGHGFLPGGADPALLLLDDGQAGNHGRLLLLGRVLGHFARKACTRGLGQRRHGRVGNGCAHRSISPNTMSRVPMMATASASMCPLHNSSNAARWAKPGSTAA